MTPQALISALREGRSRGKPEATWITANFEKRRSRPPGRPQRTRECEELFNALAFNSTVTVLELEGHLRKDLCMAAAQAIARNTTLKAFSCIIFCQDNEVGVAMANALRGHATLEAFAFQHSHNMGNEVCIALASAVRDHATLRDLRVSMSDVMDDPAGLAMADAVRGCASLQTFTFDASFNDRVGNETALALASAVKGHTKLQTFTFLAGPPIDNRICPAMADAVKGHVTLKSFTFGASRDMEDALGLAMADVVADDFGLEELVIRAPFTPVAGAARAALEGAFLRNVTLLSLKLLSREAFPEQAQRNWEVRAERHSLTELARCSANTGFHSLKERIFRKTILRYFLPPDCRVVPVEFI